MFKQPRVPEYRESDGAAKHLRALTLFLKDFCQDVWMASRNTDKGLSGISYPVTSVNKKTGDVTLNAADVGARANNWMPTAAQVGALASGGTAANATKFNGKTWAQMLTTVYPVGAIYLSISSTSPASLFGGSWEQLKDRFLLGTGSTYSNGATGGEAAHTLTEAEMPKHRHVGIYANGDTKYEFPYGAANQSVSSNLAAYTSGGKGGAHHWITAYTGGGSAHNNLPPYLVVYMWKRVS